MNFEQILREKPEVLMVTGFNGVDKTALRVQEAGIPVVYNYEWVEKTVLGRAEWIKFFGELFDCREKADSIFNEIKSEYIKCAEMAIKVTEKPTVLSGTPYKGTWYIPGGQTFMAEFFRNSGMNYFYKDNKDNFSLSLSLETVMRNFLSADIWVGVDVKTYDELSAQDERLMLFKPANNKKVYYHLNRTTKTGGNDFWESAMLRPDILLKDFIYIAHPDLLPDWELYYLGTVE
jgi:iron complex transport system substrate-binding protein